MFYCPALGDETIVSLLMMLHREQMQSAWKDGIQIHGTLQDGQAADGRQIHGRKFYFTPAMIKGLRATASKKRFRNIVKLVFEDDRNAGNG